MAKEIAKRFIEALKNLEADRDLETIVGLFSENCEIGNVVTENHDNGGGARQFWQNYRDNFDEVKSTFRNQITTDNAAALEWNSEGTSNNGHQFEYAGVSIMETDGDKITRFFAYFDPNKLGRQIVDEKSKET